MVTNRPHRGVSSPRSTNVGCVGRINRNPPKSEGSDIVLVTNKIKPNLNQYMNIQFFFSILGITTMGLLFRIFSCCIFL